MKHSSAGALGAAVLQNGTFNAHGEEALKSPEDDLPKIKRFRPLGRTGFAVSDIGIGAPWHEAVLNNALDAGVNYIDTAEAYHRGRSEMVIGRAIKNRNRKKLFITTKLGLKGKESKENILQRAGKCLERLQTDYIDCLMIWAASSVEIVKYPPFLDAVSQLKQEGKLRFAGVACHGTQWRDKSVSMEKILLAAVNSGQYDVLLMVYNFLQKEMGQRVLTVCREKNIGVTLMKTNPVGNYYRAMERLKPGNKAHASLRGFYKEYLPRFKAMADASQKFLEKYNLQKPGEIRDVAVKFALSHPGAHTVLGSMDNFETMEDFIRLSGERLSPPEKKKLSLYEKGVGRFYCRHACGMCETHCPKQVSVNTIMRFNYYFEVKNREKYAMEQYAGLYSQKANVCKECSGHCEAACPFNVPIRGLLTMAHQNLTLDTAT
ncbi:MAG: hypothetical protein GY765_07590 [bacterium]|nr:hypothetical protein [bacterium]